MPGLLPSPSAKLHPKFNMRSPSGRALSQPKTSQTVFYEAIRPRPEPREAGLTDARLRTFLRAGQPDTPMAVALARRCYLAHHLRVRANICGLQPAAAENGICGAHR